MASFPETPRPLASTTKPLQRFQSYKTLRSGSPDNGVVTTRAVRTWPLYRTPLVYGWRKDHSDFQSLIDFFHARQGGNGVFTFSDFEGIGSSPVGVPWPARLIGTTDGTTTLWDLPMKSSSSYTLLKNGSNDSANEYIGGGSPGSGQWQFIAGAGTDGRDRLKLGATGWAAGILLEWKATGRLTVWARFETDDLKDSILSAGTFNIGLPAIIETR